MDSDGADSPTYRRLKDEIITSSLEKRLEALMPTSLFKFLRSGTGNLQVNAIFEES